MCIGQAFVAYVIDLEQVVDLFFEPSSVTDIRETRRRCCRGQPKEGSFCKKCGRFRVLETELVEVFGYKDKKTGMFVERTRPELVRLLSDSLPGIMKLYDHGAQLIEPWWHDPKEEDVVWKNRVLIVAAGSDNMQKDASPVPYGCAGDIRIFSTEIDPNILKTITTSGIPGEWRLVVAGQM